MSGSLTALTFVAALGAALNGGVFFAFSTFVMSGLARLRPADGIAAMQSINVTAVRLPLLLALPRNDALARLEPGGAGAAEA
jgi:uncharacterized membrane protein